MLKSSSFRSSKHALRCMFALMLVVSSCRRNDPPESNEALVEAKAPVPAGSVALELTDEAVDDVLQKLATAAGKPIVIDPDAQVVSRCARISLLTGGNMPIGKALDLLKEALDSSGLTLVESPTGGFILRRNPDKPLPVSCRGSRLLDRPALGPGATEEDDAEKPNKFSEGIREISETEYEVSRETIDSLLENPNALTRAARVIPQMRDGKAVGLKLFGIRPKSPLHALGLKNGDTVMQVDGQSIATPDEALKVYTGLKNAKKIELTVERKGEPLKIVYRLKDPAPLDKR